MHCADCRDAHYSRCMALFWDTRNTNCEMKKKKNKTLFLFLICSDSFSVYIHSEMFVGTTTSTTRVSFRLFCFYCSRRSKQRKEQTNWMDSALNAKRIIIFCCGCCCRSPLVMTSFFTGSVVFSSVARRTVTSSSQCWCAAISDVDNECAAGLAQKKGKQHRQFM